jgi:hypothetical protein
MKKKMTDENKPANKKAKTNDDVINELVEGLHF